jgi:GR25 family glycosyltransferase involved in LPS biosynthesis
MHLINNKNKVKLVILIIIIIMSLISVSAFIINLMSVRKDNFENQVKIDIITLENDNKRLNHVKDIIKKNKEIQIFPAVDKNNKERINQIFEKYQISMNDINFGVIGCYLSHFLLIDRFLNSEYKYQIILEDDLQIVKSLPKTINSIEHLFKQINKNPEDVDILYLSNRVGCDKNYEVTGGCGTEGYVLTRHGAQKLYNILKNNCDSINKDKPNQHNTCAIDMLIQSYFKLPKQNNWGKEMKGTVNSNITVNAYKSKTPYVNLSNFDSNIN